uniref:cDNA clone:J033099I03, full insert sequence n=1 Tax=Oryza sativa subsp. japonica TaxID=39947 RepID=B7ETE8_ORYSJ|nr:unnamed protein product [Oryza sativa Japonica Group]
MLFLLLRLLLQHPGFPLLFLMLPLVNLAETSWVLTMSESEVSVIYFGLYKLLNS